MAREGLPESAKPDGLIGFSTPRLPGLWTKRCTFADLV
jgi:hypothetical protein